MQAGTIDVKAGGQAPLPSNIHILCHLIRWAAVAWIAWAIALVFLQWNDRQTITHNWGRMLGADLSKMPDSHYLAATGVVMADVAIAAVIVVFVWRLFGHYLNGRIFTRDAVGEMRHVGCAGLVAVAADILARPALAALFTLHLEDSPSLKVWGQPNDALHLLMAAFIMVVAHIFKAGVELAEDNRQII